MATLTKAQAAERDKLIRELALARALSWPMFPMPEAVESTVGPQIGWLANHHREGSGAVSRVYYDGDIIYRDVTYRNGYKREGRPIYATREDACKALIHNTAIKAAEMMARAIALLNEGE